jgi:beta-lactam-binding protein with PASTA domain
MPNVVGRNLQDAQDAIHAAGIAYFGTSQDATGRNRPHGLDLFWKVCGQTPRPGQSVPKSVVPNFSVVHTDEPCPKSS